MLHEFANRAEEPARPAAGCEGHPDIECPIVRCADLLGEEIPQCLRSSGGAKRLVDESGSQGSRAVNARGYPSTTVSWTSGCKRARREQPRGEQGVAPSVPPGTAERWRNPS